MKCPKFNPRWKEELVCDSSEGSFVIEITMGVDGVYFPSESKWKTEAPKWALDYWDDIRVQLSNWCEKNKTPLYVEESAWIEHEA